MERLLNLAHVTVNVICLYKKWKEEIEWMSNYNINKWIENKYVWEQLCENTLDKKNKFSFANFILLIWIVNKMYYL